LYIKGAVHDVSGACAPPLAPLKGNNVTASMAMCVEECVQVPTAGATKHTLLLASDARSTADQAR
jgi:hypothetical protein